MLLLARLIIAYPSQDYGYEHGMFTVTPLMLIVAEGVRCSHSGVHCLLPMAFACSYAATIKAFDLTISAYHAFVVVIVQHYH